MKNNSNISINVVINVLIYINISNNTNIKYIDINMKIEQHAFETYTKYSAWHPEDTKIAEIAQDELNHAKELQHAMMLHV